MSLGRDDFDALAFALVQSKFNFDAAERERLRAEWDPDNETVTVSNRETNEQVVYSADRLIRATSDQEIRNARKSSFGSRSSE